MEDLAQSTMTKNNDSLKAITKSFVLATPAMQ